MIRGLDSSRIKRLATENLWLIAGALISIIGSLALVRVLTHYLNPGQYGELALALTIANLINQVVMCGLISGIGRFYSIAKEHSDLQEYLAQSFRLLKYAAIVTLLIGILIFIGVWIGSGKDWLILIVVTIAFSMFSSYNGVFGDIQNAARKRHIVVFNNSLDTLLKIVFVYLAAVIFGASSSAMMIGYVITALLVFISNKLLIRITIPQKKIKVTSENRKLRNWQGQIWTYAWPFSAWGIFTWTQQASDRWALQLFSSTGEVGVFAVLFQLGYAPIVMLSGLLSSFLTPIFFNRAGDATNKSLNTSVHRINMQTSLVMLILTIVAVFISWFIHGYVFRLFVSIEFRSHSYLLPWFVLAGGLFSTGQMLVLKVLSEVRPRILLSVKIGTAVVGLILNVIGAWLAGINGVIAALVIFSSVYVLSMYWITCKSS